MRRCVFQLAGRYSSEKRWNNRDSTNDHNKSMYTKAHLEATSIESRRLHDRISFEDSSPRSVSRRDLTRGGSLVSSGGNKSLYKSWDSKHMEELLKAASPNADFFPPKLMRESLELLVPKEHLLLVKLEEDARAGRLNRMRAKQLSLLLINGIVKGISNEVRQQRIILAYALTVVVPTLEQKNAMQLFSKLAGNFEHTTTDHLAIILAYSKITGSVEVATEAIRLMKEEVAFAGGKMPEVLVDLYITCAKRIHANAPGSTWNDALKLITTSPTEKLSGRQWKNLLLLMNGPGGPPLSVVQTVVDMAVAAKEDNIRSVELWDGYLSLSPWEHALELLEKNMPAYNVKPGYNSYASVLSTMTKGKADWAETLRVFKSMAALPDPTIAEGYSTKRVRRVSEITVKHLRKMVRDQAVPDAAQLELLEHTTKVPALLEAWKKLRKEPKEPKEPKGV